MEKVEQFLSIHGMLLLRDSFLFLGAFYLLLAVWLVWCYWRGGQRSDDLDHIGCYRVSDVMAEAELWMKVYSDR